MEFLSPKFGTDDHDFDEVSLNFIKRLSTKIQLVLHCTGTMLVIFKNLVNKTDLYSGRVNDKTDVKLLWSSERPRMP